MNKKQKDAPNNPGSPNADRVDRVGVGVSKPASTEERIQQDFERLVERIRSPEHRAATEQLLDLTPEELRDFFEQPRTSRKFRAQRTPKAGTQFIPLARADELSYPCIVIASLNHFETGLGHLRGLLVVSVASANDLRDEVLHAWSEYHAQGVVIRLWDEEIQDSELVSLEPVRKILRGSMFPPSALRYVTTMHVGYA